MPKMTHFDAEGNARMVEVGEKVATDREAIAEGSIVLSAEALAAIRQRSAKKGDVLTIAQIAGIQGAKRTADLIPLCHPLPLSGVDLQFSLASDRVVVLASVRTHGKTGVEMEALTAVSVALLTIYDMLKAVDRSMEIQSVRLLEKRGGSNGHWQRAAD